MLLRKHARYYMQSFNKLHRILFGANKNSHLVFIPQRLYYCVYLYKLGISVTFEPGAGFLSK